MTADPSDSISGITAIAEEAIGLHRGDFVRSVLIGGLAGGVPYLIFSIPLADFWLSNGEVAEAIARALLPLWFTLGMTFVCGLVFGLPLTALMHRHGWECRWRYALIGLVLGFAVPFSILMIVDNSWEAGLFFAVPGVIAGAVSGFVWGSARTRKPHKAEPPTNPFHDMIH